jgi:perosamine synthetase
MIRVRIKSIIKKQIPVFNPTVTLSQAFAVGLSAYSKEISGTSDAVTKFENAFAAITNRKHGIAVTNGTHALGLALKVLGVKEGDEVILPSFAIISCLLPIIETGAIPVFIDVNKNTWNVEPSEILSAITDRTKCVIVVHTYGLPVDIEVIEEECKKRGISLIEDAAEAHGQMVGDKPCGSFGDISTFSFYANKHVTMGEGGIVLTNREDLKEKIQHQRNLGFNSTRRFYHEDFCSNYRISGLQATLGLAQIKKLKRTIDLKQKQGAYYRYLLKDHTALVSLQSEINAGSKNHYWVFGCLLTKLVDRDRVMIDLNAKGIETRPFFWALHLQPAVIRRFGTGPDLPISRSLGESGLYLPMGQGITRRKQRMIVKELIRSIKGSE